MNYFKINYNRLENLYQIKFYIVIIIIMCVVLYLIFLSCFMYTYKKITLIGYYNENILYIKINSKLSDKIKNGKYLEFNNQKSLYNILEYGEYEIINNEIYQEVKLKLENSFINNEVGTVKILYDKQKIIMYIFELFK